MARYDRGITRGGRVSIGRRIVFIGIAVILAVAILTGGIVLLKRPKSDTPATSTGVQTQTTAKKSSNMSNSNKNSDSSSQATKPTPPDPSTVKQLEVAQLGIVLNYSNTLPGMSYSIGKTTAGTTYVQLANDQLVGDKCTDDDGVFATILKNPSSTDNTTVSSTTKVGDDTYGLALPSDSCTGNTDLFSQYQASMKQNFPFLTASSTESSPTSDNSAQ